MNKATQRPRRGKARVCGGHYLLLRPGEYEPNTFIYDECVMCGDQGAVHRVSWAEIDEYDKKEVTA